MLPLKAFLGLLAACLVWSNSSHEVSEIEQLQQDFKEIENALLATSLESQALPSPKLLPIPYNQVPGEPVRLGDGNPQAEGSNGLNCLWPADCLALCGNGLGSCFRRNLPSAANCPEAKNSPKPVISTPSPTPQPTIDPQAVEELLRKVEEVEAKCPGLAEASPSPGAAPVEPVKCPPAPAAPPQPDAGWLNSHRPKPPERSPGWCDCTIAVTKAVVRTNADKDFKSRRTKSSFQYSYYPKSWRSKPFLDPEVAIPPHLPKNFTKHYAASPSPKASPAQSPSPTPTPAPKKASVQEWGDVSHFPYDYYPDSFKQIDVYEMLKEWLVSNKEIFKSMPWLKMEPRIESDLRPGSGTSKSKGAAAAAGKNPPQGHPLHQWDVKELKQLMFRIGFKQDEIEEYAEEVLEWIKAGKPAHEPVFHVTDQGAHTDPYPGKCKNKHGPSHTGNTLPGK